MDKSDVTGVASIVIGAGIAVSGTALPWNIPILSRHILFWMGAFATVFGCLWLLHAHYLHRCSRFVRQSVYATTLLIFLLVMFVVEWPLTVLCAYSLSVASQWVLLVGASAVGVCFGPWLNNRFRNAKPSGAMLDTEIMMKQIASTTGLKAAIIELDELTHAVDAAYPDSLAVTYSQRMEFYWVLLKNLIVAEKFDLLGIRLPSSKITKVSIEAIKKGYLENYDHFVFEGEWKYSSLRVKKTDVALAARMILSELRVATRGVAINPQAAQPPSPTPQA